MNKVESDKIVNRIAEKGRRPAGLHTKSKILTTRMIGLFITLFVLIAVTQIPFQSQGLVGWLTSETEILYLEHYQEPYEKIARVPVTQASLVNVPQEENKATFFDKEADENLIDEQGNNDLLDLPLRRMNGKDVLDFAQEQPEIVGGIGSVYVNIAYPESAREAGIEGRVVVSFIVDTVGVPHDLRVILPLSASCDSAVVWAIRQTRFVAGRQDGEKVPVRLRLPIKFELIDAAEPETRSALKESRALRWN